MKKQLCAVSKKIFEVSDLELQLRKKFDLEGIPKITPWIRLRELGNYWQPFNLHKRLCDKTGDALISTYRDDCPYEVYQKDLWMKSDNPIGADVKLNQSIFEQLWSFFPNNPIPHITGINESNATYADDCWFSTNIFLCHSMHECQNSQYCYRNAKITDAQYCIFANTCELCVDVVNSFNCFDVRYGLNCRQCSSSAFLYDCRNCQDCMFCFNLRNKQYCFGNQQLTKNQYEKKVAEWDLCSRQKYQKAIEFFRNMMKTLPWHKAQFIQNCETSAGNYLNDCKNSHNAYMIDKGEDCCNIFRGYETKDVLDGVGIAVKAELVVNSVMIQDSSYDIRHCFHIEKSSRLEYCAYCIQSEDCFGCCGLRGKRFHIFNKPYKKDEYHALKSKIIEHMKKIGEYGEFFPKYFSPFPYDETISGYYWPLSKQEQEKAGFRCVPVAERRNENYLSISNIPDTVENWIDEMHYNVYWDEVINKPFQITKQDVAFAKKMKTPLPYTYYMRRIQENFAWMPFNGDLRDCKCEKCQSEIKTSWPEKYDQRILCEACYLDVL